MRLGMVGLGRMGGNVTRRLRRHGHAVVVYDRISATRSELASETGAVAVDDLRHLVQALAAPRMVWSVLPAGEITEETYIKLTALLATDDILIDGANS